MKKKVSARTSRRFTWYFVAILGFLVLSILLLVTYRTNQDLRQRAQIQLVSTLNPTQSVIGIGESTDVVLSVDTAGATLTGFDIVLNYDPQTLNVNSIEKAANFPGAFILLPGTVGSSSARLALGVPPDMHLSGVIELAVLHVTGKTQTNSSLITTGSESVVSLESLGVTSLSPSTGSIKVCQLDKRTGALKCPKARGGGKPSKP